MNNERMIREECWVEKKYRKVKGGKKEMKGKGREENKQREKVSKKRKKKTRHKNKFEKR